MAERAYELYGERVKVSETEDPHTWGDPQSDWFAAKEPILNHVTRDGNPLGTLPGAATHAGEDG